MELFKNKPMAALAAVFVIVSILSSPFDEKIKLVTLLISAFVLVGIIIAAVIIKPRMSDRTKKRVPFIIILILAAVLAILNLYTRVDGKIASVSDLYGTEAKITANIKEKIYETSYSGSYIAEVTEVNGEKSKFRIRLETAFAADLALGDIVLSDVEFASLKKDGSFDEEAYYKPRGVVISAETETLTVTGRSDGVFIGISQLRNRISAMLDIAAEESGGDYGMMSALFVGDRNSLDKSVKRDFEYTGASHLLAVSGAHFTILLGGIEFVLRKLTMHKTPKTMLMIALVVFYMALTGFSASVLRAGIMLILYHLSHFARREPDSVTSLFVSVGIIFIFSPFSAEDTGLLLSFAAMFAFIIAEKIGIPKMIADLCAKLKEKGLFPKMIASGIKMLYMSAFTGTVVIVMTLPIMWMVFGRVSLLSPISTAILELPVTAVLYLAPLVVITFRIPWLCDLFSYPCSFFCRLSVWLVRALVKTDGAEFVLPSESVFAAVFCVIIVVCIMIFTAAEKRTAKMAAVSLFLCITTLFVGVSIHRATYDDDNVTYIRSAKNEGFAVTDGVRSLVCDVSTGGWNITSTCVEEVMGRGASRVNVYLLTHLHARHEKTAAKLLEREYVDEIWLPSPIIEKDTEIISTISALAEENNVKVKIYDRGTELTFGDIRIDTASAMIDRSTHPTITLSFESENNDVRERLTYVGSSVHEGGAFLHAVDMCRASDTVIFGIHGPVIKSGAEYKLHKTTSVIYADPSVAEWFVDMNPVDSWEVSK